MSVGKIVGIVQARMSSTRLPDKMLIDICGKPMLEIVFERLRTSRRVDEWVLATTTNPLDDVLVEFGRAHDVGVFRGDEDDVLDRFYRAALAHRADVIVRNTGDNPFADGDFVDLTINRFFGGDFHYAGGTLGKRFPLGMNVEVVRTNDLAIAWRETTNPSWREHVTPFFYNQPDRFRSLGMRWTRNVHHMRWTVDTPEDLAFARTVFGYFGRFDFGWRAAIDACRAHPDWLQINAEIPQKPVIND